MLALETESVEFVIISESVGLKTFSKNLRRKETFWVSVDRSVEW